MKPPQTTSPARAVRHQETATGWNKCIFKWGVTIAPHARSALDRPRADSATPRML